MRNILLTILSLALALGAIQACASPQNPARPSAEVRRENEKNAGPTLTGAARAGAGGGIVLVGNTFIEREQVESYIETMLTVQHAGPITVRNLGWSGDDLTGIARAGFGKPEEGHAKLVKEVCDARPSMILIGYGMNESFEGEAGLAKFVAEYEKLLGDLAATRARMVLVSPIQHEDLGRPLPDPAEHNHQLKLYVDAIRKIAETHGCVFVDLFEGLSDARSAPEPLTENGIQPGAYGYWRAGLAIAHAIEPKISGSEVELAADGKVAAKGCAVTKVQVSGRAIRFRCLGEVLPPPSMTQGTGIWPVFRFKGLAPGRYVMKAGQATVAVGTAEEWAKGIELRSGPEFEQVEKLRRTIIEKNMLFFRRWRPANDTYLLLFRKYEQGNNAVELEQMDPMIAAKEKEIGKLRVPVSVQYSMEATKE